LLSPSPVRPGTAGPLFPAPLRGSNRGLQRGPFKASGRLLDNVPSEDSPLLLDGLTVRYGSVVAVEDLSLEVRSGEIYGLLGSNGAGKSSTIKSVVGLVKPTGGRVRVFGWDPQTDSLPVKERVGYVPETQMLYDALTPREFLEFVASVRRLDMTAVHRRVREFLEAFQMWEEVDRPISTLSNGTRQKTLLIAALIHRPSLLVLDEPFNNLDPRSVRIMKDLLTSYVRSGERAALFSTHTMEVAQQLCHRIGILDHGRLVGEGTLADLQSRIRNDRASLEDVFLKVTSEEEEVARAVRALEEE
jgi:ABC-2 type transport system ATP-binding protein